MFGMFLWHVCWVGGDAGSILAHMCGDALMVKIHLNQLVTGMEFSETENKVLQRGEPPILMEPVVATINIEKPGQPTAYLLDHDGLRTDKTLDISEGILEIDGARDRTPFYLVQY